MSCRVQGSLNPTGGEVKGKFGTTHCMHPLVAPSIRRAEVTFALNRFTTAPIARLVLVFTVRADPLGLAASVIVRHAAGAVVILDFNVVGVTPDAVEQRWRGKRREERG